MQTGRLQWACQSFYSNANPPIEIKPPLVGCLLPITSHSSPVCCQIKTTVWPKQHFPYLANFSQIFTLKLSGSSEMNDTSHSLLLGCQHSACALSDYWLSMSQYVISSSHSRETIRMIRVFFLVSTLILACAAQESSSPTTPTTTSTTTPTTTSTTTPTTTPTNDHTGSSSPRPGPSPIQCRQSLSWT